MARSAISLGTVLALAGVVLSGIALAHSPPPPPPPRIAPPHTHPQGQSYGNWATEWWRWALGVPASRNPILDETGEFCAERQVGRVWFLGGSFGSEPVERACTIPLRTALFFPLINTIHGAFLNDPPEQRTEAFVRSETACERPTLLEAEIDGAPVENPFQYFTGGGRSPLFNVQLPQDNVFGADETVIPELLLSPRAAAGYYLFVKPLPPGEHTISWRATWSCPFSEEPFMEDITYHLTVAPGGGNGR